MSINSRYVSSGLKKDKHHSQISLGGKSPKKSRNNSRASSRNKILLNASSSLAQELLNTYSSNEIGLK